MAMNSRERVLTALNHEEPDRVPVVLAYGKPESLGRRYGKEEQARAFRQDILTVGFASPPSPAGAIRDRYLPDLPAAATIDAWGRATLPSVTGHDAQTISPLAAVTAIDELTRYPFPDYTADACHAQLDQTVRQWQEQGLAVQGQMSQTIFEVGWGICGMERTMMDLVVEPDFVLAAFDHILEQRLFQARRYAQAGVDILRLGDDVGTQRGMMLSPDLWRRHLKPRLARVIAAARQVKPALAINYHSDGDIQPIIDDLIEIGVTILNPIQPECMDPAMIKRRFGDRLTLQGTIGAQSTLPLADPVEVRATVAQRIAQCAPGGGFIIGPTHGIGAETPWANIVAFYEAVEEYGRYPLAREQA
jgi:uroporphyrinogen decarboxylase